MELKQLRGLGAARLAALERAGILTAEDLVQCFPVSYRDTRTVSPISALREGAFCCVRGTLAAPPRRSFYRRLARISATLTDGSGRLPLIWFNQPWMLSQLESGRELLLSGTPERDRQGRLYINNARIEQTQALLPQYRPPAGVPGKLFAACIVQALDALDSVCPETLPEAVRMRYHLCERGFAIRQLHAPQDDLSLHWAQRRVTFERLLLYQAALAMLRGMPGRARRVPRDTRQAERFWQSLPFAPTAAQRRVLEEILNDMARDTAMRRLVQGDVGCGKTAVAFAAMFCAVQAGLQCALMAPTEILSRQHLESAQRALEPLGVRCGLLLGGMKAQERREAVRAIAQGEWQVVIGTHALLSDQLQFANLGLVVTDEQHRFGVHQRQKLAQKAPVGLEPHVLVMSATPIPRSLALALYGDLDISVVDELPPGRKSVRTRIVPESKRAGLYDFLLRQAAAGRQAYIVCPLVEESEISEAKNAQDMFASLRGGALSSLRLGLTYGTQNADEKQRTLAAFARGELDVLVATTVIEVGVNVPNATVMVIENADRFGLSQLHQLRGRVGRGAEESWCFLMAEPNERLNALCATSDGFEIARKDLEMRGAGEFLGAAQHGFGAQELLWADPRLLAETQECLRWLQNDPDQAKAFAQVQQSAAALFARRLATVALN